MVGPYGPARKRASDCQVRPSFWGFWTPNATIRDTNSSAGGRRNGNCNRSANADGAASKSEARSEDSGDDLGFRGDVTESHADFFSDSGSEIERAESEITSRSWDLWPWGGVPNRRQHDGGAETGSACGSRTEESDAYSVRR